MDATTTCARLLERQPHIKSCLQTAAAEGIGSVNAILTAAGAQPSPPSGATFALNILLHVFVFFVILTVLYQTVISPMEEKGLATEVKTKLGQAVTNAVANAAPATQKALQAALPALLRLQAITPTSDPVRLLHNQAVLTRAWTIAAVLGIVFVVTGSVLAVTGVSMKQMMGHVCAENAILLTLLAVIEGTFFMTVASKYVPVMPSTLITSTFQALRTNF